jgi:hypothetical protein
LRWVHRFERPFGTRYENRWEDRIRNYYLGWTELGLATGDMEQHFAELIGRENCQRIIASLRPAHARSSQAPTPRRMRQAAGCEVAVSEG